MPVLSYTCESLQLLFEELGLALSKPISRLLAWLMIALLSENTGASVSPCGETPRR